MVTNTKANIEKGNSMERENTRGPTALFSKETSVKGCDMETEYGSRQNIMEIFTSEPTWTIKKAGMEGMSGPTGVFTKETSQKTSSNFFIYLDMERVALFTLTANK